MNDDVVTLLTTRVATKSTTTSKSSSSEQDLTSVSPSVSLFKFNHVDSNDTNANEMAKAASIDEQIKHLEDQARHLREKLNLSISSSLNNSFKQLDSYKAIVINHQAATNGDEHDAESHNLDMNWLTQPNNYGVSSTPKAGSLNHYHMGASVNNFSNDLRSDDVYFSQVK